MTTCRLPALVGGVTDRRRRRLRRTSRNQRASRFDELEAQISGLFDEQ